MGGTRRKKKIKWYKLVLVTEKKEQDVLNNKCIHEGNNRKEEWKHDKAVKFNSYKTTIHKKRIQQYKVLKLCRNQAYPNTLYRLWDTLLNADMILKEGKRIYEFNGVKCSTKQMKCAIRIQQMFN